MSVSTTWYYKPTNSANYPRSPRPGMVAPTFMTERKEKTMIAEPPYTPRALGTPRNTLRERDTPSTPRLVRSSDSYQDYLARMSRPTMASRYRFECPQFSFSYTNRTETFDNKYIWKQMPFLADSYRCMYSRYGAVKEGTKLGFKGK